MYRIIEKSLLEWKKSKRRKPLVLRGARQVGKTWLVREILGKKFEHLALVDLEARRDAHAYFKDNLDPKQILKGIEFITGRVIPGKTLLFLDEIQACPRAVMALRYFYEEMPELHVVAAGSLLEFAFSQISVPVGRVQYLYIHPMTFYEYLSALGKDVMAEKLLTPPNQAQETIQRAILHELRNYFFIGGMPEAVRTYRDTHSFLETFSVQTNILDSFREDFHKYNPHVAVDCLDAVLTNASRSVGEQLKYTRLDANHNYKTNHKAFDLLVKAKVLHRIASCDPSGLPLGASRGKRFKACMLDIGLLQRLCGLDAQTVLAEKNLLAMYRGKLAEQFVQQEMLAWHQRELFYWAREAKSANAEVDCLTVRQGRIYPMEVKSGPAGRLKSLHLMLQTYPNCPQGWVLQDAAYNALPDQKLVFWPLYATPLLGDREQLPL